MSRRLDTEALIFGGGLEVLLNAELEPLQAGERLTVVTGAKATALEIHSWARSGGHTASDGPADADGSFLVEIERGPHARVLGDPLPPPSDALRLRDGQLHTSELRASHDVPEHAANTGGFAPLGAVPERGAPEFDWALSERDAIWADDVAELAEQGTAAQWDASKDIPWEQAAGLPDFMERAVCQVMTFIAQNEYAALYVPASFLSDINPAFPEMAMWLAGHVHDEARHIEVFTKRALLSGQPSYALASTELSLHSLIEERDFSGSALLLNVLGEGTFLDLLKFVALHAPDPATEAAASLAHRDEVRHVHFGISHIRRRLELEPELQGELVAAAERRASRLTQMSGLSPLLTEGLTVMAAGSLAPADLARGAQAVQGLMATMEDNRLRRLRSAGFDAKTAQHLSDLHTPNLM